MPIIDNIPQLTIYRDGLANLNGEATRALPPGTESLLLLPPTRQAGWWMAIPATAALAGNTPLHGRADPGNMRFRAYELAVALFAALPAARKSVRLALQPAAAGGWHLVAH